MINFSTHSMSGETCFRGRALTSGIDSLLIVLIMLVFCTSSAEGQPRGEPMLWQSAPFDRVELINNDKIDIEPARIRPGRKFNVGPDEYVGTPGLPPVNELNREARYRIRLIADATEYYVVGRNVKRIEFFEDILLADSRRLMREGRFDDAQATLVVISDRSPTWPGLIDAQIEICYREVEVLLPALQYPRAVMLLIEEKRLRDLREASGTKPKTEDSVQPIRDRMELATERWVEALLREGRFEESRRAVGRLESAYPDSGTAKKFRGELTERASKALAEMTQETNPASARKLLELAMEMTPDGPEVRKRAEEFAPKYYVLRSAVEHLPSFRQGLAGWTDADWRVADLLHLPIGQVSSLDDQGKFVSRVVASLVKENVNKRAVLELVPNIVWPGDGKPVTSVDLERLLLASARQGSPLYHPALARLLSNLTTADYHHLTIEFDRPQAQPGVWLQIPFLRFAVDPSLPRNVSDQQFGLSGLGPFRLREVNETKRVFAKNERYCEPGKPLLAEIRETKYRTATQRLEALADGRADLIVDLPARYHPQVASIKGAKLVRSAVPRIAVLQFNFTRRELRNRNLRRAIDLAIPREAIIKAMSLEGSATIVTAPFPKDSFAYNAKITARTPDTQHAKLLFASVRKELGTIGNFRLRHAGNETAKIASDKIAAALASMGLNVSVVSGDVDTQTDPFDFDLRYESFLATDPVYDTITVLTRNNPGLGQHASPWFRQKVIELMELPNLATARKLLPELHELLHDEIDLIPLWQWNDSFVIGEQVKGIPEAAVRPYDRITEATVGIVYPPAGWSKTEGTRAP